MKKVLFIASVKEHIYAFHIPYMKWFKNHGWEVHVTAKNDLDVNLPFCDRFIEIPFCRSPFDFKNISAYRQLKKVIVSGGYDIVHCHTPMVSALTRLAARQSRKNGLKVIYTAHGFHFFKGAPVINWLIYYPVEKFFARHTDALITINKEDYEFAAQHHFKCGNLFLVPGVGVEPSRVNPTSEERRCCLRKEYGISEDKFILFYAAELCYRKNHEFILRSIPELKGMIPNLQVLFAGYGDLEEKLKDLSVELRVTPYVEFLGYRNDVGNLIALSDVGISSSRQEGLPINIVEDMLTGVPVVGSDCRGNTSLIEDGVNGYLYHQGDTVAFIEAIIRLYQNPDLRRKFGANAKETIKKFSIENALAAHAEIYKLFI